MKKFVMIILAALILLGSCSRSSEPTDISPTMESTETETALNTQTPSATADPSLEPTETPLTFDVDFVSDKSLNGLLMEQDIPEETTQLILVVVGQIYDKMYLMEKHENGMWLIAIGPFDVQLGKNGLGKESEGDGKSPEGIFELGYAFGRDAAPANTIWPWRTSEDGDFWIEDSNSKYYNMFVQDGTVEDADWKNYSNLNIAAFARAVEIRYNPDREPNVGSAIFLHIWLSSTKDTNGCTAISRENINTLIAWLDPQANTVIAQLPHEVVGYGDLVYLTDVTCDIIADIKFAQEDNILGMKLDGYNDNQVVTKIDVAHGLKRANEMLESYGAKLIVYEAYRPTDAFYQFRDWLNDEDDTTGKEEYYKDIDKDKLMEEYFAYDSDRLYLRAQVVHVALADLSGNYMDMGGEYMVFDEFTSYESGGLSQEVIYNRELLHDIMIQAGFSSVDNQWWKFEFSPYLYDTKYDEIIG